MYKIQHSEEVTKDQYTLIEQLIVTVRTSDVYT